MTHDICVVADIGGTNTRVALTRDGAVLEESIRRYRNAENAGIEPVLKDFLSDKDVVPMGVCVDMAGPVKDGVGTLTNLAWKVDSSTLKSATGASRVAVLNDLQAQGFAVPHLQGDSLAPLLPGRDAPQDAVRLVLNVGTGLNAVPVYSQGARTLVPPAEAGHVALLARNAEELRLVDWITNKLGLPGLEEVLSGRGLEHVYAWVCAEERDGAPLSAAEIMEAFISGDRKAERAARMFVAYLGRYAGDLALINLPFGGIFLVGGVARHLGPHLLSLGFAESFADKGRFSTYMEQFPVHQVTDDYAALRGCAAHLAELMTAQA